VTNLIYSNKFNNTL